MSKLNIATFNLDKNNGKFPERIHHLSNIIYKNRFDILCLQEDFNSDKFSSGKFLNIELDYNYVTTKLRKKNRSGILSSSNLTILSKYDMALLEEIYFDKNKEELAAQIVKIDFENYGILLINTQLSHLSSRSRVEQIKKILNKIEKIDADIKILCGDFNALPNYKEIEAIKIDGFENENIEFTHEDKVILDYIFYKTDSNISIVESKVLLKGFSDHYCLFNKFNFN